MRLQTKAVIGINVFIILSCVCMGLLGYRSAAEGFAQSLQMKAESNVKSLLEIMEYRYPGAMHEMSDASEELASLARSLQDEVKRFKI
mgnify:CR=1 FL=1